MLHTPKISLSLLLTIIFTTGLVTDVPGCGLQVRFSWKPSPQQQVAGYAIHYGLSYASMSSGPCNYQNEIDIGLPEPEPDGRIHATVSGLDLGETYCFAVTAYDANGTDGYASNVIQETIKTPAPLVMGLVTSRE